MIAREASPSPSDTAYQREQARLDRLRTKILGLYCAIVYPLFFGLDLVTYPEEALRFGSMRAAIAALALGVIALGFLASERVAANAARLLALVATALIAVMCALTEGFESSYMVGIIICLLGVTTLELYRPRALALMTLLVVVVYVALNLWLHPSFEARDMAGALSFLIGAAFFCLVSATLLDAQRRSLFASQMLLAARNAELEHMHQRQREFMRTMTHELRTPLNSTLGFVELIAESTPDLSAANTRRLDRISTGSRRLLRIIDDILDLSKIEAGKLETERTSFPIKPLLEDVADATRGLLTHRDVEVVVDAPEALTLYSDEKRVRQILVNLSGNAAKFTPEGTIRLAASRTGDAVVLTVSDTGVGISREKHREIFDAFTQTDAGVAKGGTGLGLNIVARLTALLDGTITLDSDEGEGATFRVTLPAVEEMK